MAKIEYVEKSRANKTKMNGCIHPARGMTKSGESALSPLSDR
jgi:hypothetical protein